MPEQPIESTNKSSQAKVIRRVEAVDLFKFFILFFMVQGHLFRAYLTEPLRLTDWFAFHELLHGLVAPGFLFSAGFAAFLSYNNKKEQYVTLGVGVIDRIKRILFVVWAGYWVHLPFFSLRKTYNLIAKGEATHFLQANILQCIGVGLLLFLFIAVVFRYEKVIVGVSGLVGLLFFLLPPLVHEVRIWFVIDPYFDHNLSFFALFPWAGYVFLGVICAYVYSVMRPEMYFKWLLILGIIFFPWYLWTAGTEYHKAELTFFGNLQKIGGVFLLLWFSYWIVSHFKGRWLEIFKKAANESLFIYVIHLFIIFNSLIIDGPYRKFNNALNVMEALSVLIIVELLVFSLALGYHHIKKKYPRLWRYGFYTFWAVFFILFIIRKY